MFLLASSSLPAADLTEFIWTEAPFPSAHASTIAETPSGALVAAWFGGTDEGNPDVGIWSARREPGAAAWTPPALVFKEPKQPAWNPVLFNGPDGKLQLWFKIGPSPQEWSGGLTKSADGGKTWEAPEWLPSGLLGPIRAKPITLADGSILAGTSFESYRTWASWMERSGDGGKTWTKHGPLTFAEPDLNRKGTIQPALLEIEPGVVRALLRTRGMGQLATALSRDGGRTWGPVELLPVDHPGAGIDAVKLKDGRCAMIHNPSRARRSPLSIALSDDGGATWREALEVERLGDKEPGELSYPAMIQGADGAIHVSYTWKRQRIKHGRIPLELLK